MRRTVAVTGAYGYLGSIIRSRLDAAGWTTVALVRAPRPGDRAVTWTLGGSLPDDVLRESDALVHCAYDFRPRKHDDVWRVNVQGSSDLLEAARRLGVRRGVVLSSMSAYSGTSQLYGQAKLAIEDMTLRLGWVAVRPGLVYGDAPAGMTGALMKLTRLPVVPVLGGKAQQFPVHEDDLAKAIVDVLDAPVWTPDVFGIAQPEAMSFRRLLAALAAREGRSCRFVLVPWRAVYAVLRLVETTGVMLPLRSDSVLGLVRPAPSVPRSKSFPTMLDTLRPLAERERV
jgi:nucleoside-diphosphate-sugar epimerase